MEVHFTGDLQAKLEKLAMETGRSQDELVRDAVVGYVEELIQVREMLDRRYDEVKSGKVKAIDGEEVFAQLRQKSESRRTSDR